MKASLLLFYPLSIMDAPERARHDAIVRAASAREVEAPCFLPRCAGTATIAYPDDRHFTVVCSACLNDENGIIED